MSPDLERLVRDARSALPLPSARATNDAREAVLGAIVRRRRNRIRASATVVVLLCATALGIGAGLWIAPAGGASSGVEVTGLGFLPATGWTVVQSSAAGPGRLNAVAATVAVDPRDVPLDGAPMATIETLPPDGVVIFAEFGARGNVAVDRAYPRVTDVPQIDDLYRETRWSAQIRPQDPVAQYRLQFATGAYNVDVRVYLGRLYPTAGQLENAQRQLDRMFVAGEPVTIAASPRVVRWAEPVTFTGSVASGRANETVELQERRCGSVVGWTKATETHTDGGGNWHLRWGTGITTTYRAVSGGATSAAVTVSARPSVTVKQTTRTQFYVGVRALKRFRSTTAVLERFDRSRGRWVTVKRVRMRDVGAAGITVGMAGRVNATLPPRTLVRAVFPRAAAAPCYLAGFSNLLLTR